MRSFLSFHFKPAEPFEGHLEGVAKLVRPWLGGEGLGAYLVPDTPWVSLYLEALEAQEDPKEVLAFLLELSQLGEAVAFMVLNEEDLLFAQAEGGELKALLARGEEVGVPLWSSPKGEAPQEGLLDAFQKGEPPSGHVLHQVAFGLDEALALAFGHGQGGLEVPPVAAVMRAAGVLGIHPDHAALGFLDLLEMDEEEGLPEEVLYLEGRE